VRLVAVFAVILVITVVTVMMLLKEQKSTLTPLKIIPDHVDIQVKNVVYTDVGAEGTKWEVRAGTATYLRKEGKALFEKVKVTLILTDGRRFVMTGDKGVVSTESKNMDIFGHVTILSDDGDKINMDELHYTERDRIFKSNSFVYHENARMKIQGKGMVLSLATRELRLLSAVEATTKTK
jgi:LPS export ABC transporter protein LptC